MKAEEWWNDVKGLKREREREKLKTPKYRTQINYFWDGSNLPFWFIPPFLNKYSHF